MAAFIAKQVVGKKLEAVKGALSDKEEKEDRKSDDEEQAQAIAEARQEAEEKRKEKHRKMEEERERMRQDIRDKYGLKKREELCDPYQDQMGDGRFCKKLSSAGLGSDTGNEEQQQQQQGASAIPRNFDELTSKVASIPDKVISGVAEMQNKCRVQ